jgi:hypothetical protein
MQEVIRRQVTVKNNLNFIFNSFDTDDGYVEIPKLIQETTQSGLISEAADKDGFAILLWNKGQITQPITEVAIKSFFNPDVVCV